MKMVFIISKVTGAAIIAADEHQMAV